MLTTALEWNASIEDILRFELGLSKEEVHEIMEELSGAEND